MVVSTVTALVWTGGPGLRSAIAASSQAARGNASSARAKAPPPDLSLTSQEYVGRGFPSPDHAWSSADFGKAVTMLAAFGQAEPTRLPRFGSKRSGSVFARLTQIDALGTIKDRSLPSGQRIGTALGVQKATSQLLKLYLAALGKGAVAGADVIEAMGAVLRTAVAFSIPIDEFITTLDKKDASYATRMDGLNQMKKGLGEMAEGTLISLSERDVFQKDELIRLIAFIDETFPPLMSHMRPEMQKSTLARMESLLHSPTMKDLAPNLTPVYVKLKSGR
jgi:hypothetical protein